jgi:hypothetical protein
MNEAEKKALERYPHDYPERNGYIEGYKAALESVKLKAGEMIEGLNYLYRNGQYPFSSLSSKTRDDVYVLRLLGKYIEMQMSKER